MVPGQIFSLLSVGQSPSAEAQKQESERFEVMVNKVHKLEQLKSPDQKTLKQMIELYAQLKQFDKVVSTYQKLDSSHLTESVDNSLFQAYMHTNLEAAK